MGLQAFEVQVCAKTETRGLKMAFLVKGPQAVVSVISQLFQGEPSGIKTAGVNFITIEILVCLHFAP